MEKSFDYEKIESIVSRVVREKLSEQDSKHRTDMQNEEYRREREKAERARTDNQILTALGEIKTELAQLNSTLSQFMQAHQVQKPQTEVERQVFGAFEGETGPNQQKL